MAGDILHFAQAFFLELRISDGQNFVHNQNLVCAFPKLQSPAGLPAAAYLGAPGASVQAPNAPQTQTPTAHTSQSYTASRVCRYTAHSRKTPQSHQTSARFGLLSSRFAKPCGPAYGTLSRRRPSSRFGLPHPQNGAVQENVLICASPLALHPLGQPSVARPTGFPALRFPSGQLRMEPRADLQQRSNPTFNLNLPRTLSGNPG